MQLNCNLIATGFNFGCNLVKVSQGLVKNLVKEVLNTAEIKPQEGSDKE